VLLPRIHVAGLPRACWSARARRSSSRSLGSLVRQSLVTGPPYSSQCQPIRCVQDPSSYADSSSSDQLMSSSSGTGRCAINHRQARSPLNVGQLPVPSLVTTALVRLSQQSLTQAPQEVSTSGLLHSPPLKVVPLIRPLALQ
jgi:hypothetical protein